MRLLIIAAVVLSIIALVCAAIPTTVAGAGWPIWLISAFVAYFLDLLFGSYVVWGRPLPPR